MIKPPLVFSTAAYHSHQQTLLFNFNSTRLQLHSYWLLLRSLQSQIRNHFIPFLCFQMQNCFIVANQSCLYLTHFQLANACLKKCPFSWLCFVNLNGFVKSLWNWGSPFVLKTQVYWIDPARNWKKTSQKNRRLLNFH